MSDYDIATSLAAQLQRAVSSVSDSIAKEGLLALKRVLDASGFQKSRYLKNYEVFSHVNGGVVSFEILLDLESTDIDPKKLKQAADQALEAQEDAARRTYVILQRGGNTRVARMRNVLRPARHANVPVKSALRPMKHAAQSTYKDSSQRLMEHKVAASAPRGMNLNREGKLSIQFEKQTRTTSSGDLHYPQGHFQGIVKDFMDALNKIIVDKFTPELEHILSTYTS